MNSEINLTMKNKTDEETNKKLSFSGVGWSGRAWEQ
jgi:hypothetical protein